MVNINFRADEQLKADLLTLAKADKRDLSSFLNKVLSDYVESKQSPVYKKGIISEGYEIPLKNKGIYTVTDVGDATRKGKAVKDDLLPDSEVEMSPQMRQYMKKPSKKR